MSKPIEITTERLLLTPLSLQHASDNYVGWLNDEDVIKYTEITAPYTSTELKTFLENVDRDKELLCWAIHIKGSNKHIGNVKISPVNKRHGYAEYSILMGDKTEWGKGYASEASRAVVDYCFKKENIRKIVLGVVEDNVAAVELYKKMGFVTEGVFVKHGIYDGKYSNVLRMGIFNEAEK